MERFLCRGNCLRRDGGTEVFTGDHRGIGNGATGRRRCVAVGFGFIKQQNAAAGRDSNAADRQRRSGSNGRGVLQGAVAEVFYRTGNIAKRHQRAITKIVLPKVIGNGKAGIGGGAAVADADGIGDGIGIAIGRQNSGFFG